MLGRYFSYLTRIVNRNGDVWVFFLSILISIALIIGGLLLREMESVRVDEGALFNARLDVEKTRFEAATEKLKVEFEGAIAANTAELNSLKSDIKESLKQSELDQQLQAAKAAAENDERFRKIVNDLADFKLKTLEATTRRELDFERARMEDKLNWQIARARLEQEFRTSTSDYRRDAERIVALGNDLTPLLQDIREDLQNLETTALENPAGAEAIGLASVIRARIKLDAFLAEYATQPVPPATIEPITSYPETPQSLPPLAARDLELVEMPAAMRVEREAHALDRAHIDSLLDTQLSAVPEIAREMVESLEVLVEEGKFWLIPFSIGILLLIHSLLFGLHLGQPPESQSV